MILAQALEHTRSELATLRGNALRSTLATLPSIKTGSVDSIPTKVCADGLQSGYNDGVVVVDMVMYISEYAFNGI